MFLKFREDRDERKQSVTTEEYKLIQEFVAAGRALLRRDPPQGLTYVEAGMAIRLADGTDLAFLPSLATPGMAGGVPIAQAAPSTSRGGRDGSIQMGDYPVTGPREPRHDRATGNY
jgi:hypothetical protein